jgi:hypothetical protein
MDNSRFWNGEFGAIYEVEYFSIWNTVALDGVIFPSPDAPFALKSMSGGVGFDIDKRKRKNRSGRKKVATGSKNPQWQMVFSFWSIEQYQAWQRRLPEINPHLAANKMKTRRVYHPFLADYEITQATIYRLDLPQWDSGLQGEVTLYFEEVLTDDKDAKKTLKPTNNTEDNTRAINKEFISDDGPPEPLQSRLP